MKHISFQTEQSQTPIEDEIIINPEEIDTLIEFFLDGAGPSNENGTEEEKSFTVSVKVNPTVQNNEDIIEINTNPPCSAGHIEIKVKWANFILPKC